MCSYFKDFKKQHSKMQNIPEILMSQINQWEDIQLKNLPGFTEDELWESYNTIKLEVEDFKTLVKAGLWAQVVLGLSLST